MKRVGIVVGIVVVLGACGGGDSGEPPLATVEAQLGALAVNDTSIFAIDKADAKVIEIGLADGALIGKLPSTGAVSEVAAYGGWVAWIEAEGTGKVIKRRKVSGVIDSTRPQTPNPRIIATADGLVYSDGMLVALWKDDGSNPDRIALTDGNNEVIGIDLAFTYTLEADTSVKKWPRSGDPGEAILPASKDATMKDGQIAHRTTEGIRERDLTSGFDRVVGMPPAEYGCELLIAGRAVMCGKYRAMDGMITELIDEPSGYTSAGKTVVWVKSDGKQSELFAVDAELVEE